MSKKRLTTAQLVKIREGISSDVEKYLKAGGKIEQVESGVTGEKPLTRARKPKRTTKGKYS